MKSSFAAVRRPFAVFAVALVLPLSAPSNAASGLYSRAELLAMHWLPPYCADSELSREYQGYGLAAKHWRARMGEQFFVRIHHYCNGLIHLRTARLAPKGSSVRDFRTRWAIGEFNFLLKWSPEALRPFPLWPEMLARRGEAALLREDWVLASHSYDMARQVKPDYWPAYLEWAEALMSLKLQNRARDLIKEGLVVDPRVEPMREAFVRYGGSLQEIPAAPPSTAAASSAAEVGAGVPPTAASAPSSAPSR